MKLIVLCALSIICTSATGIKAISTPPISYLGSWKVTLLCTENYCQGSGGITEQATGGHESQVWVVSQKNGVYVLDAGPRLRLTGGQIIGNELHFNQIVGDSHTSAAQRIMFTVDKKGKLVGKYNLAPPSATGICIKRYTVTGQQ